MNNAARIVRIVEVRDTRAFEEVSRNGRDVMVPVPGTGEIRECDRCSRLHEVHATVELDTGAVVVVGTGCMRGDAMLPELRRAAARATTQAKNAAKLAKLEDRLVELQRICAEVDALPRPAIEGLGVERAYGERFELRAGDTTVWVAHGAHGIEERIESLRYSWREKRRRERGMKLCELEHVHQQLADLRRRASK